MKDRIDWLLDRVARTESGNNYSKINPDDNGHGVSVGLIQFNAKRGLLPGLFQAMARVDGLAFHQRAPRYGLRLLNMSWVSEADLNEPTVKAEILALLGYGPFQQVQRDLARSEYFEPAWKAAQAAGLRSERAAAMCFDIAVQYGVGGLREKLAQARNPFFKEQQESAFLGCLAALADRHDYDKGRRHAMLFDRALSDAPFDPTTPAPAEPRVLRRGMEGTDVRELQRHLSQLGYRITGWSVSEPARFGAHTERMVGDFQAEHGLEPDGIYGPATRKALVAALTAQENPKP